MNKKGQTTVGQILIGVFLFVFLIMSAFGFFAGHMAQNNVVLSDAVDEAEFQASFERFQGNLNDTVEDVDSEKREIPIIGPTLDFFATGIDSIKAAWNSIEFMKDYTTFAQKNSPLGKVLPQEFFTLFIGITTIILVLVVLGALWRYPLTK